MSSTARGIALFWLQFFFIWYVIPLIIVTTGVLRSFGRFNFFELSNPFRLLQTHGMSFSSLHGNGTLLHQGLVSSDGCRFTCPKTMFMSACCSVFRAFFPTNGGLPLNADHHGMARRQVAVPVVVRPRAAAHRLSRSRVPRSMRGFWCFAWLERSKAAQGS